MFSKSVSMVSSTNIQKETFQQKKLKRSSCLILITVDKRTKDSVGPKEVSRSPRHPDCGESMLYSSPAAQADS